MSGKSHCFPDNVAPNLPDRRIHVWPVLFQHFRGEIYQYNLRQYLHGTISNTKKKETCKCVMHNSMIILDIEDL